MPRRSGGVRMLEHIAASIDPRSLAVPHGKHAVVARLREEVELLRAPDCRRGEVLIHARLEADVVRLEMLARAPQALVEAAEGRAAIARNESSGVDAGAHVALAL